MGWPSGGGSRARPDCMSAAAATSGLVGVSTLSGDSLAVVMLTACRHTPIKQQTVGWMSLVTIDVDSNRVQAIPIASIYSGGLHFTRDDVVWYSSGKGEEAAKTQTYVEA